jgi:hypothetical protein
LPLLDQFDPSRWQPRGTVDDITQRASQPFTLPVGPQDWWGQAQDYLSTGAGQLGQAIPAIQDIYGQAKSGNLMDAAGQALGAMEFATPYKGKFGGALGLLGKGYHRMMGDK